jgi:hypothetical protein
MPVVSGEQVARMIRSTNNHNQNTPSKSSSQWITSYRMLIISHRCYELRTIGFHYRGRYPLLRHPEQASDKSRSCQDPLQTRVRAICLWRRRGHYDQGRYSPSFRFQFEHHSRFGSLAATLHEPDYTHDLFSDHLYHITTILLASICKFFHT